MATASYHSFGTSLWNGLAALASTKGRELLIIQGGPLIQDAGAEGAPAPEGVASGSLLLQQLRHLATGPAAHEAEGLCAVMAEEEAKGIASGDNQGPPRA